jgi:hypothetical protein
MHQASHKEKGKRIVLIHWKKDDETEIFSNLKNFCLSYPQYNYNTLNNYLSREKMAYENRSIRVERKYIITRPKPSVNCYKNSRSIEPVLRRIRIHEADEDNYDLQYWLAQPVKKRAEAMMFLISQMLKKGERMNKTIVNKIRPGK